VLPVWRSAPCLALVAIWLMVRAEPERADLRPRLELVHEHRGEAFAHRDVALEAAVVALARLFAMTSCRI